MHVQCKVPSYIQLDYEAILVNTNSSFVLQSRSTGITLKGQMLPTSVQLPGEHGAYLAGTGRCTAGLRVRQHSVVSAAACCMPDACFPARPPATFPWLCALYVLCC